MAPVCYEIAPCINGSTRQQFLHAVLNFYRLKMFVYQSAFGMTPFLCDSWALVILNCDNKVIRILAIMHKCSIDLILYKYCIPSVNMRASNIKEHVETFCWWCIQKWQNTVLLICIIWLAHFRIVYFMILVSFVVVLVYCFLCFCIWCLSSCLNVLCVFFICTAMRHNKWWWW